MQLKRISSGGLLGKTLFLISTRASQSSSMHTVQRMVKVFVCAMDVAGAYAGALLPLSQLQGRKVSTKFQGEQTNKLLLVHVLR